MQKFIDKLYIAGLILLSIALIYFGLISEMETTELGGIIGWNTTFLQIPLLLSIFGYLIINKKIESTDPDGNMQQLMQSFGFAFLGSYLLCFLLSLTYTNFGMNAFKAIYFIISFVIIGLIIYKKKNHNKLIN